MTLPAPTPDIDEDDPDAFDPEPEESAEDRYWDRKIDEYFDERGGE